jgi:hypothetical protein
MSDYANSDQSRDAMLLNVLRTPLPRKKRDRGGEAKPKSVGVESALSKQPVYR